MVILRGLAAVSYRPRGATKHFRLQRPEFLNNACKVPAPDILYINLTGIRRRIAQGYGIITRPSYLWVRTNAIFIKFVPSNCNPRTVSTSRSTALASPNHERQTLYIRAQIKHGGTTLIFITFALKTFKRNRHKP